MNRLYKMLLSCVLSTAILTSCSANPVDTILDDVNDHLPENSEINSVDPDTSDSRATRSVSTESDWTATPDISSAIEADSNPLYALLETNNSCNLPCFFGIYPGITTLDEARAILANYSEQGLVLDKVFNNEDLKLYNAQIASNYDVSLLMVIRLEVADSIVHKIQVSADISKDGHYAVDSNIFSRYSLREVLGQVGYPDQLYIIPPDPSINNPSYRIDAIYFAHNMIISYLGRGTFADEKITICPNIGEGNIGVIEIISLSSEYEVDIRELSLINFDEDDFAMPIDDFLGISLEAFYNELSEVPSCFSSQ